MPTKPPTHASTQKRKTDNRPSPRLRGYTTAWDKASKRFRRDHPFCAVCLVQNKLAAARVVDHIIPHKGDDRLFWDEGNWQALCSACHNEKTAREDGGFGNTTRQTHSKAAYEGR